MVFSFLQRALGLVRVQMVGVLAALASQLAAQAAEPAAPLGAPSALVAQTVWGILGYTRWPGEPAVVQLCIAGETLHATALLEGAELAGGRKVAARRVRVEERSPLESCHALYAGRLRTGEWAQWMAAWPSGQPLLTLSEDALHCQSGGTFCLDTSGKTISFELNLDSMARSGVRVNPRVLGLARRKEAN